MAGKKLFLLTLLATLLVFGQAAVDYSDFVELDYVEYETDDYEFESDIIQTDSDYMAFVYLDDMDMSAYLLVVDGEGEEEAEEEITDMAGETFALTSTMDGNIWVHYEYNNTDEDDDDYLQIDVFDEMGEEELDTIMVEEDLWSDFCHGPGLEATVDGYIWVTASCGNMTGASIYDYYNTVRPYVQVYNEDGTIETDFFAVGMDYFDLMAGTGFLVNNWQTNEVYGFFYSVDPTTWSWEDFVAVQFDSDGTNMGEMVDFGSMQVVGGTIFDDEALGWINYTDNGDNTADIVAYVLYDLEVDDMFTVAMDVNTTYGMSAAAATDEDGNTFLFYADLWNGCYAYVFAQDGTSVKDTWRVDDEDDDYGCHGTGVDVDEDGRFGLVWSAVNDDMEFAVMTMMYDSESENFAVVAEAEMITEWDEDSGEVSEFTSNEDGTFTLILSYEDDEDEATYHDMSTIDFDASSSPSSSGSSAGFEAVSRWMVAGLATLFAYLFM